MRCTNWTLAPESDGTVSVLRGNRLLRDGLSELAARQLIGRSLGPGDRVHQAEGDGYLTEVTKQFVVPRRGGGDGSDPAAARPVAGPVRDADGEDPGQDEDDGGPRLWPRHDWPRHEWTTHP